MSPNTGFRVNFPVILVKILMNLKYFPEPVLQPLVFLRILPDAIEPGFYF